MKVASIKKIILADFLLFLLAQAQTGVTIFTPLEHAIKQTACLWILYRNIRFARCFPVTV